MGYRYDGRSAPNDRLNLSAIHEGHSLGGALSALLGATFGAPVVAFEAPGEKLASTRLHLPSPVRPIHL